MQHSPQTYSATTCATVELVLPSGTILVGFFTLLILSMNLNKCKFPHIGMKNQMHDAGWGYLA